MRHHSTNDIFSSAENMADAPARVLYRGGAHTLNEVSESIDWHYKWRGS